jgi:DNA-binding CsgD family transcriptional regulator
MASKIQRERLLHHVDAIYQCVIDPSKWDEMLGELVDDLGFHNSIISAISMSSGRMVSQAWIGIPPEYALVMNDYVEDVLDIWGGQSKVMSFPQGEPVIQSNATDRSTWPRLGWYRDWVEPQGLIDAVVIALIRGGIVANVAFGRHGSKGPVTDFEMDALRLLAPHFARAFEITNLVDMSRAQSTTFWEALKVIAAGVVLVDAEGHVVRANATAEKMIATGDPLLERSGRLQLRGDELETKAFDDVLSAAVNREVRNTGIVGVPGRWLDGRRCVAHVMPLPPDAALSAAAAAVFVSESNQARPPRESLALLFDLTPAELRIMELVSNGKTRGAVASELSIAPATVKVHLRSVFRKTSTTRQPELVRLIRGLAPPA